MPIAHFNPDVPIEPKPVLPAAQPDNYKGLTYDNNQTPVVSLLAYVEGAPWSVTYYRQTLGEHNDLKEIDPNLSPQYQSYSRIEAMELRVQAELDSTTDNTTQMTSVEGSAIVYGFIEPNVNDYFITETSYKRPALFRVTNVDRQTWRRESVHTIQYKLVDYLERLEQQVADLKRKTTTEYVFSRERLMEGLTPYLKTDQYQMVTDLRNARTTIGNYYLNAFANTSSKTLIFPGQTSKRIYDSFLVDFVMATFGYLEFPQLIGIKQLPKSGDIYLEQPQFWKAIMNRDLNSIIYGNKKMKLAATKSFNDNLYIKGLYSARVDFIVYPNLPDTSVPSLDELAPRPVFDEELMPTTNANGLILLDEDKTYTDGVITVVGYHPANKDGYYVLSQAFYDNDGEGMSLIELMTRDYLMERTIDHKQLKFMIELYPQMERMQQLYYGPLLLCLMRYEDQRVY